MTAGSDLRLWPIEQDHHGADDERRRDQRDQGDLLAEHDRSERDRDDRVHERVRGCRGDRNVVQEPDVRDVADERADEDQVDEGGNRGEGHVAEVHVAELSGGHAGDAEQRTAGDHLHPDRRERLAGCRCVARVQRTERPEERRDQDHERLPVPRAAATGTDEQDDAGEPDRDADRRRPVDPAPAERRGEQRHPERDRGDDERDEPARQVLLAPGNAAIAEEQQAAADDRSPTANG